MAAQRSLFECLKAGAPPDQFLVVDVDPSKNRWEERPYEFARKDGQIFTWAGHLHLPFKKDTRYFKSEPCWPHGGDTLPLDQDDNTQRMVPVLKSQIQKAVRRCLPLQGIQAAWVCLKQDPLELLRRLPIIMIEDKRSHEDLPLLIWGMLHFGKNPDWKMPVAFVRRVMHLVWDICSCTDMTVFDRSLAKVVPKEVLELRAGKINRLSAQDKMMVYCPLIRAEYGGTQVDVAMLRRYAFWWAHEPLVAIPSSYGKIEIPHPDVTMVGRWIPWAFDFHVTGVVGWLIEKLGHEEIAKVLSQSFKGTSILDHAKFLQRTIWFYWSSVRYCTICETTDSGCPHQLIYGGGENLKLLWNLIKPSVEGYARMAIDELTRTKKKRKLEEDVKGVSDPIAKWSFLGGAKMELDSPE